MRIVLFVICAIISALSATWYVISLNNAGLGISAEGLSYQTPNHAMLVAAIVFGIFAIALLVEPYLKERK